MKMPRRLLFISRIRADAHGSGGQQRRHALLAALEKVASVDQLILGYDPAARGADELYLPSLNRPPHDLPRKLPFVDPALLRLAQGFAENSVRLGGEDRRVLRQRIEAGGYDVIFCNRAIAACVTLAALGDDAPRFRLLTDLDDVISDVMLAQLRVKRRSWGLQASVAAALEALYTRKMERRTIRASRSSFVCSTDDAAKLERRYPGARVAVVPNVTGARLLPARLSGALRLLFVGSLDYAPNLDGLGWFLDRLWPVARARFGEQISLAVVGRGTGELVASLRGIDGVEVHLNVPEVEPYYRDADACVVPIRYGGGTSIKTIEAMAAGRPLLSTPVGVRGLGLMPGEHYLRFEDADDFVEACAALIDAPGRATALAAAAHRFWEGHFSQAAVDRAIAAALD